MKSSTKSWLLSLIGVIVVVGIVVAGLSYFVYWDETVKIGSMAINYVKYWSAPAGNLTTDIAQNAPAAQQSGTVGSASPPQAAPGETEADWPSYNKTVTSNRFSP